MLALSNNVYVVLALVNILMLVLGMFMELVPIMFILAPIMFPWLAQMGVSEVQFGVVMVLNLMIGMITPPIGLNLMVLSAISGRGGDADLPRRGTLRVGAAGGADPDHLRSLRSRLFVPQLFYPVEMKGASAWQLI